MDSPVKYPLAESFELDLVAAFVGVPRFFDRFAEHVDAELFNHPMHVQLVGACKALFDVYGRGPSGVSVLVQYFKTRHAERKLSTDNWVLMLEYLAQLEEREYPEVEQLADMFADILRRQIRGQALEGAISAYLAQGDLSEAADQLKAVEDIGKVSLSVGDDLSTLVEDLEEEAKVQRLSMGCPDLNAAMDGGQLAGDMVFYLGPSKSGKSAALNGRAVDARRSGFNVVTISLELGSTKWRARHAAGLTGTPFTDILRNPRTSIWLERMQQVHEDYPWLGKWKLKKLPPGCSLGTMFDAISRIEDNWSEKAHLVQIDYLDRARGNPADGLYTQMGELYEGFRLYCEDSKRWGQTASQAKGHVQQGDMPKMGDCADSQNKVRVADGMLGIQKMIGEMLGKVCTQMLAGRSYPETEVLGPYDAGHKYGVFFASTALPDSGARVRYQRAAEALRDSPFFY
jgi:hypothetical protein